MIPFQVTNWDTLPSTSSEGETGTASTKTVELDGITLRKVIFSAGYTSDHWCTKGHIVYCIAGSFTIALADGQSFELQAGMTFQVSDDQSSHQLISAEGTELLIMDGDFLR